MPGRKDEKAVSNAFANAVQRLDDERLLALMGAGGNPDATADAHVASQ